jgi:biotin carboxylase
VPRRLLFIESNTTGSGMLALRMAARLDTEPVLITSSPGRYAGLDETGATVRTCDTSCAGSLLALARELAPVAGVTTTSEFYLPAVASVAAELGLPGNPPAAARLCRNKAAVRRALAAAGVPQPRFAEIRSAAQVPAVVALTGLPCVVKPVDDSGSSNVRVCADLAQASAQARAVLAVRVNVRGQRAAGTALIESYVPGPEFSVEMFSADGRAELVGITQKTLTEPPFCVETGHLYPADVSPADALALEESAAVLLSTLGVRAGPTHTEVRLTPDGPVVIELNGRLAGGMIPELIRLADGVDLLDQQLRWATGERPCIPPPARRAGRRAGIRFITAARPGVFRSVVGLDAARAVPGVVHATVTMRPGTETGPPTCAYDRIGYVIAAGDTAGSVRSALDAAAAAVTVTYE